MAMATSSLLLESISPLKPKPYPLRSNPQLLKFRSQFPLPSIRNPRLRPLSPLPSIRNPRLHPLSTLNPSPVITEASTSPFDGAVRSLLETLKTLQKPAATAVLVGLLLLADPYAAAMAASGGRVGGRSFSSSSRSSSSSSRSSSSSSSRRYSTPSTRSSSSRSSSSSRYSDPSSFSDSVPYSDPSYDVAIFFFVLMMCVGLPAVAILHWFLSERSDDGSVLTAAQKTSVLKLQVGLLGMARSLQNDLDQIAKIADTSTAQGLHYVLTESALSLLRHPECCISGYSFVDLKRSSEDGEKRFNQLSIEERGKFDEETLVNVDNIKRQKNSSQRSKGFNNEYIVVTIIVAVEGVRKLPVISSSADLKDALQNLGSIPSDKIMAVEVLWTPQKKNDTLSERELIEDYPLLRPL